MSRQRLRRAACWLVLGAAVFLGLPAQFGGQTTYTLIAGQSRSPTYATGDLLIERPQSQYRVGEVVVYRVPAGQPGQGRGVVHRIVGGSSTEGWVLQGDNNDEIDIWRPRGDDIRSATVLCIPKVGYLLHYATHPMIVVLLGSITIGRLLWPTNGEAPDSVGVRGLGAAAISCRTAP